MSSHQTRQLQAKAKPSRLSRYKIRGSHNLASIRNYVVLGMLYLLISLAILHPQVSKLTTNVFMLGGDPESFIWYLGWWPFALTHHLNPLYSSAVWSPSGINLTWATSIPTLSLLCWPATSLLGPTFSWNLLNLLAPVLNSLACFALLFHLYGRRSAAFLGGFFFGFSSYVSGQILGHINLSFVCLIPILVLLFIRRSEGSIDRRKFIFLTAATLSIQLGISIEILATSVFFGFLAILTFAAFMPALRRPFYKSSIDFILASLFSLLICAPFVVYLLIGYRSLPPSIYNPLGFSTDLLNFIIPTPTTALGGSTLASISKHFTGNFSEDGAYIGIPVIILSLFALRRLFVENRNLAFGFLTLLVVAVLFTLGPILQVNGTYTHFVLPWTIMQKIPFLRDALPSRFSMYISLLFAVLLTYWISRSSHKTSRLIGALAAFAFIIPNPSSYSWTSVATPAVLTQSDFFDGTNVLVFPYSYTGSSMYWQSEAGYRFAQADGNTGIVPLPFRHQLLVRDLLYGGGDSSMKYLIRSYIHQFHVQYVLQCPGTPQDVASVLRSEDWTNITRSGCLIYKPTQNNHFYNISGEVWSGYTSYGWIGTYATIRTSQMSVKVELTGLYIPSRVGPITIHMILPGGKNTVYILHPGSSKKVVVLLHNQQTLRVIANKTWSPATIFSIPDPRQLSISMQVSRT